MGTAPADVAVSCDLFGTLVAVERPPKPAVAVAEELEFHNVTVPTDWEAAYAEPHVDAPDGVEVALSAHVTAALRSRGVELDAPAGETPTAVRSAVRAAFERDVTTIDGATDAIDAIGDRSRVGVLSNCSVPGLVERTIERSELDSAAFDAVVSSFDCGWRKPHPNAFETIAERLGVTPTELIHVGDDPRTDGGADAIGATAVLTEDVPISELPAGMEAPGWPP